MPKKRKKSYDGQDRTVRNAAQTLLANIRFANVDNPVKAFVVTSSVPNEGKSTISIELAKAIAAGGRTVLLVECDMRRRSLAAELGIHPAHGLYSVLAGQNELDKTIVAVEKNFWFLDVEPHIPNPPESIASKRFRRFVEDVRGRFNYVVFDTPPLGAFVDSAVLSTIVDGTVMVVRENYVKRSELQDAFAQLQSAGANVLGVCMNFCREGRSEYYYAYYDKQGNRVRTSDDEPEPVMGGAAGGGSPIPLPIRMPRRPGEVVQAPSETPAQGQAQVQAPLQPHMPVNRTKPTPHVHLKDKLREP